MNLVGYLRYSPRPQVRWTLGKQKDEILAWASTRGHQILAWYVDKAVSGDDNGGKVARQALLASVRQHEAEGVVIADLSRWTREEAVPALYFIHQLEVAGVRVLSAWEDFANQ